jgi:hypothetical protein
MSRLVSNISFVVPAGDGTCQLYHVSLTAVGTAIIGANRKYSKIPESARNRTFAFRRQEFTCHRILRILRNFRL